VEKAAVEHEALRRDVYWIRLSDGQVFIGDVRGGLVIENPEVAYEVARRLDENGSALNGSALGGRANGEADAVMERLRERNFIRSVKPRGSRLITKVSDDDLLRRAAPEIEITSLRRNFRGLVAAVDAGLDAGLDATPLAAIKSRTKLSITIFGSNRLAYSLLALLQASGFSQTAMVNRQRALRGGKSRHPSNSRISPLLATGAPIRKADVGRLHSEVGDEVSAAASLNQINGFLSKSFQLIIATQYVPPEISQEWMSEGLAHLSISDLESGSLTVGPWVQPGQTPCSQCIDLHRSIYNPHIARVRMMQSVSEPTESPASLVALVTGAVVLGVLEFHETGAAPWFGGTTEFDALNPCNPRHMMWQFNSACGCLEVI
jgi:hypothetical protein